MKYRNSLCLRGFVAVVLLSVSAAMTAQEIQFEFSMAKQDSRGNESNLDWKKDLVMAVGDKFSFTLKPAKTTVIYLIYEDADKTMALLYPTNPPQALVNGRIPIPGDGNVFTISDPPGTEKIYIIALDKPDQALASAISALANPAKAVRASEEIQDRLAALKTRYSKMAQAAEKPVSVAGTSRGPSSPEVTEIKGGSFYAKTIRIKH